MRRNLACFFVLCYAGNPKLAVGREERDVKSYIFKGKMDGEGAIKRDEERLNNPDFRSRAPADKVAEVEARLAESKTQLARIETFLRTLGE
jgi:valyl-tRNA synthetase